MIATDKFLFVHLHKSGGTFINHAILSHIPSAKRIGYHLPYRYRKNEYQRLPVLGSVRNPWGFYISFYHFQANSEHPNYVYQVFSNRGQNDLEATLMNMANPHPHHFEMLRQFAPYDFVGRGVNLTKNCIDEMSTKSGGWYSLLFERMYQGCEPHFLRMETLREDFNLFLAGVGISDPHFSSYILNSRKKNVTSYGHYTAYYGKVLERSIADADSGLIQKFGYAFEDLSQH
jgi:hypothetical protein